MKWNAVQVWWIPGYSVCKICSIKFIKLLVNSDVHIRVCSQNKWWWCCWGGEGGELEDIHKAIFSYIYLQVNVSVSSCSAVFKESVRRHYHIFISVWHSHWYTLNQTWLQTNYFELIYYRSTQQRFTLFSSMQCSIPNVLIQTGMW